MTPAHPPSPRHARRLRLFAVLAATAAIAAACATSGRDLAHSSSRERSAAPSSTVRPPTTPRGPATGALKWSTCTNDRAKAADLQCATLAVPLDPAEPDGRMIDLELARSKSTGPASRRIGSLLFNPGGPGGSGIESLASLSTMVPERISQSFDLVSWDPRGVGESTPVHCLDAAAKDKQVAGDLSPDTPEEVQRTIADQKEWRAGCEKNNRDLVTHMSTADVAGDLDRIRAALGDDKLNYVGFSYGTSIGATYATLFPDKVRAMVLDGSVSPTADDLTQNIEQAKGFEHTYQNFVSACDASPQCALTGGAAAKVDAVRQRLDQTPIPVTTKSGTHDLGRDQFDLGLGTALYDTSMWGTAAQAIANIDKGGAEVIMSFMDLQVGRKPDGTWDNQTDAQSMVNCADSTERPTTDQALAAAPQLEAASPTFGPMFSTSMLGCVDWPKAAEPTPTPAPKGAPTILVVGTVGDPATPYQWAQQMTDALGSAVLLTYEGDGHTAFLRGGDCIDNAVTDYLVALKVPAAGTSCPAVANSTGFGGIRDEFVKELVKSGIPQATAECITDGIIAELGESKLQQLLLGQDAEEQAKVLTPLVTKLATKCLAGG